MLVKQIALGPICECQMARNIFEFPSVDSISHHVPMADDVSNQLFPHFFAGSGQGWAAIFSRELNVMWQIAANLANRSLSTRIKKIVLNRLREFIFSVFCHSIFTAIYVEGGQVRPPSVVLSYIRRT